MNRVASMISTLLRVAAVSPALEQRVVSELMVAVGHGQIDLDLVNKVPHVAACTELCQCGHFYSAIIFTLSNRPGAVYLLAL